MNRLRSVVLLASIGVVLLLVGGGLVVNVGAAESSYRQAVLFAEILAQVSDNYVDPIDPTVLLDGAYEGMLAGLDPNGAYLSPTEVAEWKKKRPDGLVGPGFSVLRVGRVLQVVAVEPGSGAETAGLKIGDHLRSIDGALAADLSLGQARRRLEGEAGTVVRLEVLHPADSFRREMIEAVRHAPRARGFALSIDNGIAILRILDLRALDSAQVATELAHAHSSDVDQLLLDLRFVAEGGPHDLGPAAGGLAGPIKLRLRDRSGRLLDSVDQAAAKPVWPGSVAVLVNGATAGGSEALALLLRIERSARVYGQATYGLGSEPKLYELDNGAGVLMSSARWETEVGQTWNGDGVAPDEVIEGKGDDPVAAGADQLHQVLDRLHAQAAQPVHAS
jgi:carboxyl-terminal processing protease